MPKDANPGGLSRLSDVLITFDVQAEYDGGLVPAATSGALQSRSVLLSALMLDTAGLGTLRGPGSSGTVTFRLDEMSIPGAAQSPKITNVAIMLPGIDAGKINAELRLASSGTNVKVTIEDGLALSNAGHLSDGVAANVHALNVVAGANLMQSIELEVSTGGPTSSLETLRDVNLWLEYEHAA